MTDAEKLLSRMRVSKTGWGQKDLASLYVGFGFEFREGSNHRFYYHPRHRELLATVARHNSLALGYITTAIKLIDKLKEMENSNE